MVEYAGYIIAAFFLAYIPLIIWDKRQHDRSWLDVARAQALMPAVFILMLSAAVPLPIEFLLFSSPLLLVGGGVSLHWALGERRKKLSEDARLRLSASLPADPAPALALANERDAVIAVRRDHQRSMLMVRLPLVIAGVAGAIGSWWLAAGAGVIAALGYVRDRRGGRPALPERISASSTNAETGSSPQHPNGSPKSPEAVGGHPSSPDGPFLDKDDAT